MAEALGVVISRRRAFWRKLAALVPLVLLALAVPGQAWTRCRITGQALESCCCPGDDEADAPSPAAALRTEDCCERIAPPDAPPAAELQRAGAADPVAPAARAVAAFEAIAPLLAEPGLVSWGWQRHGPPRGGPSLVVLKRAFLI
jgi:hypothetical protein